MTNTATTTTDLYARALAAEPRLQPIANLVAALVGLAPTAESGRVMCSGCVWTSIVKPLVLPLVGWERGYPAEAARDPDAARSSWTPVDLTGLYALSAARDETREPATTPTEVWLRGMDAWNAVTRTWQNRLWDADPGNGHGIGT